MCTKQDVEEGKERLKTILYFYFKTFIIHIMGFNPAFPCYKTRCPMLDAVLVYFELKTLILFVYLAHFLVSNEKKGQKLFLYRK